MLAFFFQVLIVSDVYKNILKGIMSGGVGVATAFLIQVVTVPLFVSNWGVQIYADWLMISALPMMLSVTDLGIINTLSNRAAFAYSKGRVYTVERYLSTAFLAIIPVSIAILLLMYFLVTTFVKKDVLRDFDLVLIVLMVHAFMCLVCNFLASSFRAIRLFHVGSLGVNLARLAEFFAICVVLLLDKSPLVLAFSLCFCRVIACVILWVILSFCIVIRFSYASVSLFLLNFRESASYFLIPLSQLGYSQALIFLVGAKFDAASVVFFNSARVLCRFMLLGGNALTGAWRQELTRFFACGQRGEFFALFKRLVLFNGLLVFLCFLFLLLFGEFVFDFWLNDSDFYVFWPFFSILVSVSFSALILPYQVALISLNKHYIYGICLFFVSLASISLFFLMPSFEGFLVQVLFFEIVVAVVVLLLFKITVLDSKREKIIS